MSDRFSPTVHPPVKQLETKRPWFRFSVKSILILTALVALVMAMVVAPLLFAIGICVFHIVLSGVLLIGAIFGRGWVQAFAIASSVPHILAWFLFAIDGPGPGPEGLLIVGLIAQAITIGSGFAGASLHGILARRGGKMPIPNIPFIRNWFSNGAED